MPQLVRRVPKPRTTGHLDSPMRNLVAGMAFTISVMLLATLGYMAVGRSFRDAFYLAVITIYTVGYGEVHPIDTPALSALTISLMVFAGGRGRRCGARAPAFAADRVRNRSEDS